MDSTRDHPHFGGVNNFGGHVDMVTSTVGVSRQGLRDWVVQRITAVIMAIYSVGLFGFILCNPGMDYITWHALFLQTGMKIATLLFIASVLFHAWVGIWTILTDYVKIFVLRFVFHVFVLLALAACFFWALLILWGV